MRLKYEPSSEPLHISAKYLKDAPGLGLALLEGFGDADAETQLQTFQGLLSSSQGHSSQGHSIFKPGPESGLDCLICAIFARKQNRGSQPVVHIRSPADQEKSCVERRERALAHKRARNLKDAPGLGLALLERFGDTLVTGPRMSLSLKLSDTRVYEPQIRARLGTAAHFCETVVLKLVQPRMVMWGGRGCAGPHTWRMPHALVWPSLRVSVMQKSRQLEWAGRTPPANIHLHDSWYKMKQCNLRILVYLVIYDSGCPFNRKVKARIWP